MSRYPLDTDTKLRVAQLVTRDLAEGEALLRYQLAAAERQLEGAFAQVDILREALSVTLEHLHAAQATERRRREAAALERQQGDGA